ncbi:MAG: M20/M25/M40 family metallo-hydrolase, partial [Candidatus Aenigmarchaeota archaeon]|nr:M20/M25/M40 family metallo-hydrolase [Candidatus Aenigmarchaeota archaeon]
MSYEYKERAVRLLEGLIRHYSPSREEQEAVKFLVERMKELGLDARIDEVGNAVATKGSGPEVLLIGHIDTVHGELPVRNDGEFIYGRGACDAKSPLATLVMAASLVENLPFKLIVAGVVEEESDSSKGAKHLIRKIKPRHAFLGEPSNTNGVTIGYKGRILAKCSAYAPKGHSASLMENAIEKGLLFYEGLRKEFDDGTSFDKVMMNMTYAASSGKDFNVNPHEFKFAIDIRVPPDMSAYEMAERIVKKAPRDIKVNFTEILDGVETDMNDPAARALVKSIRKHGLKPRFVRKLSSSDMNIINSKVRTVAYGPGESKLDHTDEERVKIEDYLLA